LKNLLQRQHYKIVGRHSAVKICHWTKKSIRDEGFCYKQKFYGIESHRCLQMAPAVSWCTHRCVFCWRNTEYTLGTELLECDEPSEIIDEAVKKHRDLLSGFGGIPDDINMKKYRESSEPKHAAISLSGEPTVYPKLDELIGEFTRRGFTTYLVSNGTFPERLKLLDNLPTQLYLSLDAPNEEVYRKTDLPLLADGWGRIKESLGLMPSFDTRTVVRLTLVKGWNMTSVTDYAKLISTADPDFVEVKAFMFVGGSRTRLSIDNMPSFNEVKAFSEQLARDLSYSMKDFKEDSRVFLLTRKD